jgi:phosphinothricin acetyltransferase
MHHRLSLSPSDRRLDVGAGQGLGKLLLQALIEACERLGRKQMLAVIGDSTNAASIGLHLSFGFRQVLLLLLFLFFYKSCS